MEIFMQTSKLIAATACLCASACLGLTTDCDQVRAGEQPSSATSVKIGFINSTSGAEAPIGENLTNGVTLAVKDLAQEGIHVDLYTGDDIGKPQIAMSAFEELASDGVAGVVGPYTSSCANAVAKLSEKYRVPELIPVAAKTEITKQGYKWVYRLNSTSEQYASTILDAALRFGKPKTIVFIYENSDFGSSTFDAAKNYAAEKGLTILGSESYSPGNPDFRSTLSKFKSEKPDLVFMVSYATDAVLIMRQSREIGLQPQAFLGGGAGFTTAQFASETAISEQVMTDTQWTNDVKWPGAQAFYDRYKSEFGKEPSYHAACAYESMKIMAETAAKAGGDREKTRLELKAGHWTGIMGDVKFEDYDGFTNQNKHQMLVQQIQDGHYVTVFPTQYASKAVIYPFRRWNQ
jgi:branched-chain amino acid transport system substrate-binding protein